MKTMTLEQLAQKINGTIACGNQNYVVNGLTAIGSAKDNEICIISNGYELSRLTKDVKAVIAQVELNPCLHRAKVPNIIVVRDIEIVQQNLMDEFTKLNS